MIKHKKYLWLSLPLFISPVAIIASCTNNSNEQEPPVDQIPPTDDDVVETPSELPSDGVEDWIKAFANVDAWLTEELSKMHLFKPSQIGPTANNSSPMFNLPYPVLDTRQNFGFESKYKVTKDDDEKGEKTIQLTLSRGGEKHDKTIVLKGFLTNEQEQNEKENHLNPAKVFAGFSRDFIDVINKKGLIQVVLKGEPEINDILELTGQQVIEKIKNSLLNEDQDESKFEIKALGNPVQWKPVGIKENAVRIDVQIVEKTNGKNQPKKSGIYSVKIMGFKKDNETLYDEASFDAGVYAFGSFHSPVKRNVDGKKPYLDKKASEITNTQELMSQLDLGLTSYVKAQDIELVEGSANDEEGSLKITVKLTSKFNEKWTKWVEMKLYGFAVETN